MATRRAFFSLAPAYLESEIGKLDAEVAGRAKENEIARRLMTVPGIGSLIATALAVLERVAAVLIQDTIVA